MLTCPCTKPSGSVGARADEHVHISTCTSRANILLRDLGLERDVKDVVHVTFRWRSESDATGHISSGLTSSVRSCPKFENYVTGTNLVTVDCLLEGHAMTNAQPWLRRPDAFRLCF